MSALPAPRQSVLETITPHAATFSATGMSRGQPGVPATFDWRGRTYAVAEVLDAWQETEPCRHGSRERYVRRHGYRVRTSTGEEMVLSASRATGAPAARWMLRSIA